MNAFIAFCRSIEYLCTKNKEIQQFLETSNTNYILFGLLFVFKTEMGEIDSGDKIKSRH